ncbi:hypothetical protein KNJ79_05370 [Sphingopyxis indica]|uniref:hypothetical protein n=1 Tax=Sphingopyxis indica TaxID=436663 RepID=UPI002939247C|nr:hypothetical protein [Sphingopyxis indica]WOF44363.1 hypothetical protein KNJ79_05370 [Sphingopyxis indica]
MKRPDLKIEITIGEEKREIKWTYGLSNDIQRLVPDFGAAVNDIVSDPGIRDYIIRRALTDKKGIVREESELISFEAIDDIDPEEVLRLLEWVSEHLLYFFVTSAAVTSRQAKEYSSELGRLSPSSTGSADSPSTTPPAGPSA